jgi:uncharacterized damage-inducible protein DinB
MRTRAQLAHALLEQAGQTLVANLEAVTLEEALSSAGGYRSVLGILKHTAGWSHVYHSYAFDAQPRHFARQEWPRGLRDTIDASAAYFAEVLAWQQASQSAWYASVRSLPDAAFDEARPVHWGAAMPLFDIVVLVANHWTYHGGEINALLSIQRGEAFELGEEMEENHISTAGHRVRPPWMNDDQFREFEAVVARRDRELHVRETP